MELEKDSTNSSTTAVEKKQHGGARPGAGRPKGSTDKVTARLLLEACQNIIGKPFEVSLLEGYRDSIVNNDRRNRAVYEKMILDKVSSTLVEAEVTTPNELIDAKQQAFQEALAKLASLSESTK